MKLPVLFYIHGGGWVFGSPDAFGRLLGELAKRADAAVFAIDYTLSPEAKYPTALDQAWATLEFIEQNAENDGKKIAIAGDSVGGNMTAITSLRAQKSRLLGQILFYPVCDFSFDSESYKDFASGYFLARDGMKWFFEQYTKGTDASPEDPRISVLRTPRDALSKAPPALVITGEADVLRDHGEQYAEKLREAGIDVTR
ncbi:hypothetical protein L7F22_051389 [Adiantum nelumboides]|nr:hypothetical protein [Adiantum nelumboides]